MSTKIYNGFRYTGSGGLMGCYRALTELRPSVEELVMKKFASFIARTSSEIIDCYALGKPLPDIAEGSSAKPFWTAFAAWKKLSEEEKEIGYFGIYDTNFDISIFPLSNKMIIGICHTPDRAWRDWFMDRDFVDEYCYFNNTDRPNDISAREWNRREKHWDAAFKSVPSENSMEMKLAPAYEPTIIAHTDPLFTVKVIHLIKPKEERALDIAQHHVMNKFYREVVRDYAEGIKYQNSEAGIAAIHDETQAILGKLIDIDRAALRD